MQPRLLTAADLADYLAVSETQVRRMARTGKLPKPLKLPGFQGMRWDRATIDAYLDKLATKAGYADPEEAWGGKHGKAA